MLAAVLKSETAIKVSVRITNTFVSMRRTLAAMAPLLARIEETERLQFEDHYRQITDQTWNEERFNEIFNAMNAKEFPKQKVFYDGEVFDAEVFASKYIVSAQESILLIDNWVDATTLELLMKKKSNVTVEIVTSSRGNRLLEHDITTFNTQYGELTLNISDQFHDRFLIIDNSKLYLIGASLKDLGKKCFAFSMLDAREIPKLKSRIVPIEQG